MTLGTFISQYRKLHDLSQRQFATMCELSNGYISMLEKGVNPATGKPVTPTIPQLQKLAKGMGITITDLFERVEDIPIDINSVTTEYHSRLSISRSLSDEEYDLIRKFRSLNESSQQLLISLVDHEFKTQSALREAEDNRAAAIIELKSELREELEDDIREEIKSEIRDELGSDILYEIRDDILDEHGRLEAESDMRREFF